MRRTSVAFVSGGGSGVPAIAQVLPRSLHWRGPKRGNLAARPPPDNPDPEPDFRSGAFSHSAPSGREPQDASWRGFLTPAGSPSVRPHGRTGRFGNLVPGPIPGNQRPVAVVSRCKGGDRAGARRANPPTPTGELDYSRLTDQQVVLLAREGREQAYRELIGRYQRPVFSLIYRP